MKEELSRKYSKEVYMACESMTYGKRKFTLPQKYRLSADFYHNSKNKELVGPVADASANIESEIFQRSMRGQIVSK